MKAHTLMLLAVVAIAALVGGFWANSVREPVVVSQLGQPLVAGLEEQVNEVTAIKLYATADEPAVTVSRGERNWQVEQKAGYRADTSQVRKLLLAVAEAKLLEEKTSNPEYYSRIGVQPVADGGNVAIELAGVNAPRIILGNRDTGRGAFYARRGDEATSWLASGDTSAPTDPMQWLDRDIVDLPAARVASIEVAHADGETLRVGKSAFGQPNYEVADLPDGGELSTATVANPMASVLEGLRFDDVLAAESFVAPEPSATVTYRTFDGLVVSIDIASADEVYYARFSASTDADTAARFQTPPETTDEEAAVGPVAAAPPDMTAIAEQAAALNDDFSGWIYTLPKFKHDQMTKRLADLLKASE